MGIQGKSSALCLRDRRLMGRLETISSSPLMPIPLHIPPTQPPNQLVDRPLQPSHTLRPVSPKRMKSAHQVYEPEQPLLVVAPLLLEV